MPHMIQACFLLHMTGERIMLRSCDKPALLELGFEIWQGIIILLCPWRCCENIWIIVYFQSTWTLQLNGGEKPMKESSLLRNLWKFSWKTNLGLQKGRIWQSGWCDAEKDKETYSENKQAVLGPCVFWSWQSLSINQVQIVQFHGEGTG